MIAVERPGAPPLELTHAVFDLNGTLAAGGELLPGVPEGLTDLGRCLEVEVLTAATYGGLDALRKRLPCRITRIDTGVDKLRRVQQLGTGVVSVGNGANDAPMLAAAALGIVVIGPEGAAGTALAAANLVVHDIAQVFHLLANPKRITATLRL
ncbi:MAG: haloacid dehalogenase [Thermaerobacter sp.]|nr:haloacid dehalogenase [Thermaerobacter sp.]